MTNLPNGQASASSDWPEVELFTDGACLGNPGPGGWAYVLRDAAGGKEREAAGGTRKTTNNRMELLAVIEGLKSLETSSRVLLCSDSQYITLGITEWLEGWKKRGWRKADRKPVLNVDLWEELDDLLQKHQVRVQWTRGHSGHPENERCDQLANAEAERQRTSR